MAEEKSVLKAVLDTKQAPSGAQRWNRAVTSMEKTTKTTGLSMLKLSAAGAGVFLAYKSMRIGVRALTSALKVGIAGVIEQERVLSQLRVGLESTNYVSGQTVAGIQEISNAMQRQTGIANEEIEQIAAVGLSFTNITGDVFPKFLKISADVSARMGQDLQSSALQLAKALNDPVANLGALSRAGIQFSKEQKTIINDLVSQNKLFEAQGIILKELENQYGGSAEAGRDTLGGAFKAMKEESADILKNLTAAFGPELRAGAESLVSLLEKGANFTKEIALMRERAALEEERREKRRLAANKETARIEGRFANRGTSSSRAFLRGNRNRAEAQFDETSGRTGGNDIYDTIGGPETEIIFETTLRGLNAIEESMLNIADASDQFGMTIARAFESAIIGGQDLKSVLKSLSQDILNLIIRQTITQPFADLVSSGIKTAMTPDNLVPGTGGKPPSISSATPGGSQKANITVNVTQKMTAEELMVLTNDLADQTPGIN